MQIEDIDNNPEVLAEWAKKNGKCIIDLDFYERMKAESHELAKKKIPQKLIPNKRGPITFYTCSNCNATIPIVMNFCHTCGVAIQH